MANNPNQSADPRWYRDFLSWTLIRSTLNRKGHSHELSTDIEVQLGTKPSGIPIWAAPTLGGQLGNQAEAWTPFTGIAHPVALPQVGRVMPFGVSIEATSATPIISLLVGG